MGVAIGWPKQPQSLSGRIFSDEKYAYTVVNITLKKISQTDATRCQILMLKCTKFDFRWGSLPDPAEGAFSAPHTP